MSRLMALLITVFTTIAFFAWSQDTKYYEMRTYHCHDGKRPDLINRFQNHTIRLFEKNGIENIAYFLPVDESNNTLTFVLAYPDRESRDVLWSKFANDPEWQKAFKESEINGPLVARIDQVFMTLAPELSTGVAKLSTGQERIFELRTYYIHPGRVEAINARFRDYTRALFEKHGMLNVVYWYTVEKDNNQPKLVYLLAHQGVDAAKKSFDMFRADPEWRNARDASEADGPIVVKVESVYLKTLPFSPLK